LPRGWFRQFAVFLLPLPSERERKQMDGEDAESRQFKVLVKNTFLDVEVPKAPDLARARTAPPPSRPSHEPLPFFSDDRTHDDSDEDHLDSLPEVSPPLELGRDTTYDDWQKAEYWTEEQWENKELWDWGADIPHPPTDLGLPQVHGGMMYPAVQMVPVMVPVVSHIGGDVGATMPGAAGSKQSESGGAQWPPPPPVAHAPTTVTSGSSTLDAKPPATGPRSSGGEPVPASNETSRGGPPALPQPQTLTRAFSVTSGFYRVYWTVDARKLRANDKQAVSPPFQLSFGDHFPNVAFKMMIYPKIVNDSKGGASFKKARGRGFVQLKCEAELFDVAAPVNFRIAIGSKETLQEPRGPVCHNFSASAVCGLRKEEEEWDFAAVVDQESMTFVVCLEIVK